MNDNPPLATAAEINAGLYEFFAPLCERFVTWRRRTVSTRSPIDVAGLVSPATEAGPRDIELFGNGVNELRSWPYFLHTFSRDSAWDIPVGAYGVTWPHQLGAIAEALRHDWDVFAQTDDNCRVMLSGLDRTLIIQSTFWGATYATREPNWWETAPGQTIREGITAVAQMMAMLTLDAVDGYETPLQLAHDAVAHGLLDRLALTMPLNTQQPMIAGRYVLPGPVLVRSAAGALDFSPAVTDFLRTQAEFYRAAVAKRTDEDRVRDGAAGAGQGCPVAGVRNGRPSVLMTIVGLFEWLINQLSRPPGRPDI